MKPVGISVGDRDYCLTEIPVPLPLEELLPGTGEWEVELGFGRGRYLLQQARENPRGRFLGVEMASPYYRLVRRRVRRRPLTNIVLIRGEALYTLAAILPRAFASRVHVYFPDPWPKVRHQKRRLFDTESVDLVLGLLKAGGRLCFATDHPQYGDMVRELLTSHPEAEVEQLSGLWPRGPRTNYEVKYEREGRSILRLRATRCPKGPAVGLHPAGELGVVAATCPRVER